MTVMWVLHSNINNSIIKALAYGPERHVHNWDHYYISDFNFYTYEYGEKQVNNDYGACVKGTDGKEYYDILQDVIELYYARDIHSCKTILFNCDWYHCINGVVVHDTYKLIEVNQMKRYPSVIHWSLQASHPTLLPALSYARQQ